jgi:hypothetical protein
MIILLEAAILAKALDTAQKLAAPVSGAITFIFDGKRLSLNSVSDLSQCKIKIPTESVEGDATEFAIPLSVIKDAVKGHDRVKISLANATLSIKGKGYTANLATVDVIPMDEMENIEFKEWTLNGDTSAWLCNAVRAVTLRPTTLLSSWIPVGIKVTPKSAFVACYDNQRISWTSSKEITGEFECVAPADTISSILDVFREQSIRVETGRGRLRVTSKTVTVSTMMPVEDDLPKLEDVMEKVKAAAKEAGDTKLVPKLILAKFFDNARSVLGKERAEIVATEEGMSVQSSTGKVTSKIEAGVFKIDYEFFVEAVGKAPVDVMLRVVGDSFLSIGTDLGSIIVAQNQ